MTSLRRLVSDGEVTKGKKYFHKVSTIECKNSKYSVAMAGAACS